MASRVVLGQPSSAISDESSSMAPYNTFNSLAPDDSMEQTRDSKSEITCFPRGTSYPTSTKPCYKVTDIIITVVIITLVWIIISVPTMLYTHHTVMLHKSTQVTTNHEANYSNNVTCTLFGEPDSICVRHLQWYTRCLIDDDTSNSQPNVYVSRTTEHYEQYISSLTAFARPLCVPTLEPLMCLYFIHLCDNGMEIGPSKEQCDYASTVCDEELVWARKYSVPVDKILSSCAQNSPFDKKRCIIGDIRIQNCSVGFYHSENSSCQPECGVWTPYSQSTVLITNILLVLSAAICVLLGVVVLLFFVTQYRRICCHPTIFIVYQTVLAMALALLVLVGVSAQKRLFCRSKNLMESVKKPTPFCFITGVAFYYIVLQLMLWWVLHTIAMFWSVAWPLHAREFSKSKIIFLHFVLVFVSIILSAVPVVIVVFVSSTPGGRGGFIITHAPPILCTGFDVHTNQWAFVFPTSLMLASGITFLVFILRIVIKKHCIHKPRTNWNAQPRMFIVLCYYIIFGMAILSIFTRFLLNANTKTLLDYFSCEKGGWLTSDSSSGCENKLNSIKAIVTPIPIAAIIAILAILPAVNLVYVVKPCEFRRGIATYSRTRYIQHIQREAGGSTPHYYVLNNEYRSATSHCDSLL